VLKFVLNPKILFLCPKFVCISIRFPKICNTHKEVHWRRGACLRGGRRRGAAQGRGVGGRLSRGGRASVAPAERSNGERAAGEEEEVAVAALTEDGGKLLRGGEGQPAGVNFVRAQSP
jgi:hypothetical protein